MKEKETSSIDGLFWKIAIKDDEIAFRTLFFQFFSPLCVFAHRYIDRWETCEDIVQETFFKILKSIHLAVTFLSQASKTLVSIFFVNRKQSSTGNKKKSKIIPYNILQEISIQP